MTKYTMQYSFSTIGNENLEVLRELRNQLAMLKGHSLVDVYRAFDMMDLTSVKEEDKLTRVDVIHTTQGKQLYSFFVLATETLQVPHANLWTGIGKKLKPHVRVDVIGSGTGGDRYCQPLFVPAGLELNDAGRA